MFAVLHDFFSGQISPFILTNDYDKLSRCVFVGTCNVKFIRLTVLTCLALTGVQFHICN